MSVCCFQLHVHSLVCFIEVLSSFRMSDDDIFHSESSQHRRCDFTGECAFLFEMHILCTHFNIGAFQLFHKCGKLNVRSTDDNICFCILHQFLQFSCNFHRFFHGVVHFPVTSNNWLTHYVASSIYRSGLQYQEEPCLPGTQVMRRLQWRCGSSCHQIQEC